MITWTYSNDENISLAQKEQAKANWLEKLGKFKDEFIEKGAFVNIDFNFPDIDDERAISFTFSSPHHHSEFIVRFNEWQLAGRP